jgi:DNA primase
MQFYHCFGCGESGDVFKFVMKMDSLTFPEAVRALAERAGIPIPRRNGPEAEGRLAAVLYEIYEVAAALFQRQLQAAEGAAARGYLERRSVTPEMIAEFRLGYALARSNPLTRLLEGKYPAEALEACGLVLKRESGGFIDRFRHRVMSPCTDDLGRVIAFGGQALIPGDLPKYLRSAATAISRHNYQRAYLGGK